MTSSGSTAVGAALHHTGGSPACRWGPSAQRGQPPKEQAFSKPCGVAQAIRTALVWRSSAAMSQRQGRRAIASYDDPRLVDLSSYISPRTLARIPRSDGALQARSPSRLPLRALQLAGFLDAPARAGDCRSADCSAARNRLTLPQKRLRTRLQVSCLSLVWPRGTRHPRRAKAGSPNCSYFWPSRLRRIRPADEEGLCESSAPRFTTSSCPLIPIVRRPRPTGRPAQGWRLEFPWPRRLGSRGTRSGVSCDRTAGAFRSRLQHARRDLRGLYAVQFYRRNPARPSSASGRTGLSSQPSCNRSRPASCASSARISASAPEVQNGEDRRGKHCWLVSN